MQRRDLRAAPLPVGRGASSSEREAISLKQKGPMSEKLLNVKEVCQYLGISEEDLRSLVDRGEIPAYRLGGTILRFKKDQIDRLKTQGVPKLSQLEEEAPPNAAEERMERLKDFIYFNDFYIICAIIALILLIIIFFY